MSYKIKGKVEIAPMPIEQVTYINELVERDTPIAPRTKKWEYNGEERISYYCTMCNESLSAGDKFCSECGQRIDTENIAL